jgi:hypothetical protein
MSDPPSPDNSVPSDLLVSIPDLEEDAQDDNQDSHDHVDPDELVRLAQRFAGEMRTANPEIDLGVIGLREISAPADVPLWLVEIITLYQNQSGKQILSVPSVSGWNDESGLDAVSAL